MKLQSHAATRNSWHVAIVLLCALLATPLAWAQRIPKDTDLKRFVPPGQEEALTGGLPEVIEAEMLGIEILAVGTVEAAAKKHPSYLWQVFPFDLSGARLTDPDDATDSRLLYFFGIENAKRMAYRNLLVNKKSFRDWVKSDKNYLKQMPAYDDVEFGCLHYGHITFFGSTRKSDEEKRKGQGWFSCTASMTLTLIHGTLRQH